MKPGTLSPAVRPSAAVGALALLCALAPAPARADLVLPRISPNASLKQTIGITEFAVTYSRPGVKGRAIWGALVPYGQPWRSGANEATTFSTSDDVLVDGQKLAAGTYSFFTIPAAEGPWTVIFSTQKELWGAYEYDPKQDALRIQATPAAAGEPTEWMQYSFEDLTPNSANLVLRWEKTKLAVPIAVDVNGITLAKARTELGQAKADDWRTRLRAAQFTFDNAVAMDEGAKWLDESIAIQPGYGNMNLKARWLAKSGDTKGAATAAKKALELNKAATTPADASALEALLAEWTGKKKK